VGVWWGGGGGEVTGVWKKQHNEELRNLFVSRIIAGLSSRN
jgi:hypothetical protein